MNVNEEKLFNAIERSVAMILFDTSGKIIWANQQFQQVIGYTLSELESMNHRQLCLDEFKNSPDYDRFWDNLRKNKAYHDKVKRMNKDMKTLYLDAIYTPVLGENGQVEHVIKIATDVTNQEIMLQKSSEEFMALVEEMTAHTNEVHRAFNTVIEEMDHLKIEATTMEENIEKIEKMADSVKNIATRSNILGLNANIEAARAGEYGRGFAVVANEIRKMSETSKLSAEDISKQVVQIKEYVLLMKKMVDEVTKNIHSNSESIQVLRQAYEQVLMTAEKLTND